MHEHLSMSSTCLGVVKDYNIGMIIKLKLVMATQPISSGRSTHKHPTFASQTKYAYPFAKTKRFPDANPPCPEAFYTFDSQLSQRKAGMGYGKKTDFATLLPNCPPSNRYHIASLF